MLEKAAKMRRPVISDSQLKCEESKEEGRVIVIQKFYSLAQSYSCYSKVLDRMCPYISKTVALAN